MSRPRLPRISLVLADVDGTLVTHDKVLTERARASIKALCDRGIRFAITSGRTPRGMAMLVDPLRLDPPIAAFNGGVFVGGDLAPIECHSLPPPLARARKSGGSGMGVSVRVGPVGRRNN